MPIWNEYDYDTRLPTIPWAPHIVSYTKDHSDGWITVSNGKKK